MAEPAPISVPTERLKSLDALRGFDMFWIVGGDALGRALGRWIYGSNNNWIYYQLEHAEWDGFRFYDLIFPLFLFMVGTSIPFSLSSMQRRGASQSAIWFRIVRRVILLFGLGLLCNGVLQLNWLKYSDDRWMVDVNHSLRVTGVLQRIAICYGIAAIVSLHTSYRGQLIAVAAILLGYWAILLYVPNPETGIAGDLTAAGNLSGYIDRHYLPGKILAKYYGFGDNEGMLSTIPAVATTLIGVLTGHWLRSAGSAALKTAMMALAGLICLGLGQLWSLQFPIIKNLWTSSYVLIAAGWSLLLLALFYAVIDGLKWQAWAFPFVVIGVNAITIYVGQRFIGFPQMTDYFLGGLIRLVGSFGPVLRAAGIVFFQWLFLLLLYRQRLFLRV